MSSKIRNRCSGVKKESAILRGAEILRNRILADKSVCSSNASIQSGTSTGSTPPPHDEIEKENCAGKVYTVRKKKKKKHEKCKMKKKNLEKSISNADKMMLDYLTNRSSISSFSNSSDLNPLHAQEKNDIEYLSKKLIKLGMKKTNRSSDSFDYLMNRSSGPSFAYSGNINPLHAQEKKDIEYLSKKIIKPGMKKTHRKSNSTGSSVKSKKSSAAPNTVCVSSDNLSGTRDIHFEDKTLGTESSSDTAERQPSESQTAAIPSRSTLHAPPQCTISCWVPPAVGSICSDMKGVLSIPPGLRKLKLSADSQRGVEEVCGGLVKIAQGCRFNSYRYGAGTHGCAVMEGAEGSARGRMGHGDGTFTGWMREGAGEKGLRMKGKSVQQEEC